MPPAHWLDKPYYSLDAYLKNAYGYKCYKIALNAHMTCPNRDGTLGTQGCLFCSAGGSGDFAVSETDIHRQLEAGLALFGQKQVGRHYIAYFQAYTNTYAPVERLRTLYTQALEHPMVCGISIATRPDCLPMPVLELLAELRRIYPDKFIWLELGLQTIHEKTARIIRRGYELPCFEEAMKKLKLLGLPVIVHVILGLPGETPEQMLKTVNYLNVWQPFGIKLQLLHVLEGTDLAALYRTQAFTVLEKEEYLDILVDCLTHLSPDIVIHRVTGDGPKKLLIAPAWSGNKRDVLNSLHRKMRLENAFQGKMY
ncbi:MAG: TIGR01212 family radical SAM protein [Acetatifactor sp.]|nr:TIGR01212 family radical SAM protein [Acetatifactor sp.]